MLDWQPQKRAILTSFMCVMEAEIGTLVTIIPDICVSHARTNVGDWLGDHIAPRVMHCCRIKGRLYCEKANSASKFNSSPWISNILLSVTRPKAQNLLLVAFNSQFELPFVGFWILYFQGFALQLEMKDMNSGRKRLQMWQKAMSVW